MSSPTVRHDGRHRSEASGGRRPARRPQGRARRREWQRCQFHLARNAIHQAPSLAIQQELKRRTVKVRVFPGEDALERLVSAILVEIDENWASDTKAYIKWECQDA